MRIDHDLEFLHRCSNDDLKQLCDILTFDNKGRYRLTERLSNSDAYIQNYPENMAGMVAEIADELLKFGTNSVVTFCHDGRPDSYEDVVRRVCKRMGVDVDRNDDAIRMERLLLENVCEKAFYNMTEEELREFAREIGVKGKDISKQALIASLLLILRRYPHIFANCIRKIVTHVVGMLGSRAAAVVGGRVVSRVLGVATGPVGWIAMTAWTIWDLASPAYRVIVPAVLQIAIMRYSSAPKLEERRAA